MFKKAEPTSRAIKAVFYGAPGTRTTLSALTFPGVAVVDGRGGTVLYRGRPDIPTFGIMETKSLSDLETIVAFLADDAGQTYQTLVIDPLTIYWKLYREAVAQGNKSREIERADWSRISMRMSTLYVALIRLPIHVVAIVSESAEYAGLGDERYITGYKADIDKDLLEYFDFLLHMQQDGGARVIKSRGLPLGDAQGFVSDVNWALFAPLAALFADGVPEQQDDEATVIAREVERERLRAEFQSQEIVKLFVDFWKREHRLMVDDLLKALGVTRFGLWTGGRAAADANVQSYLNQLEETRQQARAERERLDAEQRALRMEQELARTALMAQERAEREFAADWDAAHAENTDRDGQQLLIDEVWDEAHLEDADHNRFVEEQRALEMSIWGGDDAPEDAIELDADALAAATRELDESTEDQQLSEPEVEEVTLEPELAIEAASETPQPPTKKPTRKAKK